MKRDPFMDLAKEVVRETFVDPLMPMAPMIARALRTVAEEARERAEARVYERERRRAVQWLHERAGSMNDEHARAVLHSAATNLGWHNAREKGLVAASPFQTEEAKER